MQRGIKTPWGPIHQGVKKFDPLKIQKGPMYRGVMTTRCPMYRGLKTPQCPKHRGVVLSQASNAMERIINLYTYM